MKKTILGIAILAIFLIATLSFTTALKPESNESAKVKEIKNSTYGACVSEGAKVKNDCYASVKSAYNLCKSNVTDTKQCKSDYKKDMAQCKTDFKSVKTECKKIKHNFFETVRYSLA